MNLRRILLIATLIVATVETAASTDHKNNAKYKVLRDSMTHAFNDDHAEAAGCLGGIESERVVCDISVRVRVEGAHRRHDKAVVET